MLEISCFLQKVHNFLFIHSTIWNKYSKTIRKVKKYTDEFMYRFIIKPFISNALRHAPYVTTGSHCFTCHPHSCLYYPAARRHRPSAGTHCAYPQRDGQAELTWVAGHIPRKCHASGLNPDTVTHPSTNRTRRRVTSLMCATPCR